MSAKFGIWKCETKEEKIQSSNDEGESQIPVEMPEENHLIYTTLVLKPTNKTPIKTDEVIYSEVQNYIVFIKFYESCLIL
jgi:hypothetical protein